MSDREVIERIPRAFGNLRRIQESEAQAVTPQKGTAREPRIEKIVDAAIKFVLNEWSEAADLNGTQSMSAPAEFMLLHEAVCELKGWEPYGNYPVDGE